jgi:hypothetical protein
MGLKIGFFAIALAAESAKEFPLADIMLAEVVIPEGGGSVVGCRAHLALHSPGHVAR